MAQSDAETEAARNERDSWKRTGIWATALGATLAAAGGVAFGGPVFLAGAIVTICLRTNAELKTVESQRRLEDPPRTDFLYAVTPRLVIPFRDGFGLAPHERALAAFAHINVETVSLENAMVTAQERAEGARLYGADDIADLRFAEHRSLRLAVSRWNLQLELRIRQLVDLFGWHLEEELSSALTRMSPESSRQMWSKNLDSSLQEGFPEAIGIMADCGYPFSVLGEHSYDPQATPDFLDLKLIGTPPEERPGQLVKMLEATALSVRQYGFAVLGDISPDEEELPPTRGPLPFGSGDEPYWTSRRPDLFRDTP